VADSRSSERKVLLSLGRFLQQLVQRGLRVRDDKPLAGASCLALRFGFWRFVVMGSPMVNGPCRDRTSSKTDAPLRDE